MPRHKLLLTCAMLLISVTAWSEDPISDPLEPMNRKIFWFNDKFDSYLAEPVAHGYDYVTPDFVQDGVGNFFMNLANPAYFLSSILQGKFTQSAEILGRFVINSTVGLAGLIDVAKEVDLPHHREDFGLAFAEWGIPAGPYLVLPIIGPSNLRDAVGLAFDAVTNPLFWTQSLFGVSSDESFWIGWGGASLLYIDTRADLFDAIDTAKESSLDYYLFMQSSYYQHRRGVLFDGNPPVEEDENWADDE